ncbi:hypothetical protein QZH41_020189 [Actinostola sp. cb2023]|nr:hypothetical protein QZH41_020189 [Actinostola sp. cb2023]
MHSKVTWSAIFLVATIWFQSTSSSCAEVEEKYAILMDAGSSATRIKVYRYIEGRHDPIEPSDMIEVAVPDPDEATPDLSEFAATIDQIGDYLDDLIDSAKKVVPADQQAVTPIALFGTAGMRLLPEDEQEAILNEVDRLFSDKTYCPFFYKEGYAQVISGAKEAIFGWISLNFLKGTFSSNDSTRTFGVLDLGGASTQNTFRVRQDPISRSIHATYWVYVTAYLGYGANEARDSYIESLVNGAEILVDILPSPNGTDGTPYYPFPSSVICTKTVRPTTPSLHQ